MGPVAKWFRCPVHFSDKDVVFELGGIRFAEIQICKTTAELVLPTYCIVDKIWSTYKYDYGSLLWPWRWYIEEATLSGSMMSRNILSGRIFGFQFYCSVRVRINRYKCFTIKFIQNPLILYFWDWSITNMICNKCSRDLFARHFAWFLDKNKLMHTFYDF